MVKSFEDAVRVYSDKFDKTRTYVEGVKAIRIAGNTTLRMVKTDYVIRYHETDIVTFHADGSITLCSGGWQSVCTVRRMREHTPSNIRISGKDILSKRADANPRIIVTAYWETAPCGLPDIQVIDSAAPLTLTQY